MDLADEHFRLLVESVEDYAIYLLEPDGTVRSWNAGAQRLKGYTAAEIVGRSFSQFFSAEDRAAGKPQRLLREAFEHGRIEDVGWRIRKDGSQFWASAVLTTLRDRDGKHVGFAKVTRDLTDRSYRAFVEAAHSIVWTTDPTGRPSADSPTWRAFTGQSPEQWRSGHGWDAIHPAERDAIRISRGRATSEGVRWTSEFRLRRTDGNYVWMEASVIPLRDDHGVVREWFGVMFDISVRKAAELARERAIELWRTTLRSIGDAVISTDANGLVRFMNPIAERLTGWTNAEAAGRALHVVFPIFNEESGRAVENPVDKVLATGLIVGLANHTVLRRRDGTEVPIDDSAAPIRGPDDAIDGVVLVFRDASAEKREGMRRMFLARATEELLGAADYRAALQKVANLAVPRLADWVGIDIIVETAGSTRTQQVAVAHVDPAKIEYARELGRRYPPDPDAPTGVPNVIRTGKSEFYPEIPQELIERSALDDEHLRIIRELELRSAMVVPLRGKAQVFGAITFVFAGTSRRYTDADLYLAEDLARRAALIIERRRLEEEAEHANRMKDEFLATMSHELRTPLQAILGYATMLESGGVRDPAKAIEAIVRNANAQTRLVEDILDVSRIVTGKLRLAMTRVDLVTAIRAALESIRPTAQARRIRIVESLSADVGTVYGDFERLQQITWNLLSNAVKFSPADTEIEVRAERDNGNVRIVVEDKGKGIRAEHLSLIFERFRQLDSSTQRQQGGLGLGLAIVRYLVEAHGGTVKAESDGVGKGSRFTVTLPGHIDEARVTTGILPIPKLDGGPLHNMRILIVDDDDDTRELLGDALHDAGAHVIRAASAAEAFNRLQAQPPHLIISDIGMPNEDGYSLIRRVRALPPERGGDVPAIALTAYARPEDVRAAKEAGFQVHVVKPVRPDQLLDAVRNTARPN